MDNPKHTQHHVHQKNTLMAVLCYIGPLVIVSYLVAKNDPFVKFHIKQGLVLFFIEIAFWILMSIISIYMIWQIVHLLLVVLSIVGIVYAISGKEKELPIVGGWAKNFKI